MNAKQTIGSKKLNVSNFVLSHNLEGYTQNSVYKEFATFPFSTAAVKMSNE